MKQVEIGIENIDDIYLRYEDGMLCIEDESNDGVIQCSLKNLQQTIKIINDAYRKRVGLSQPIYGSSRETIHLSYYQTSIGKNVFYSNYIRINHMPDIVKMLKSVKVEKEKYVLNNDSLFKLCINDLVYLKQTMRRRKKVLTDENGCKYIEV